jgi:hypothetical protein
LVGGTAYLSTITNIAVPESYLPNADHDGGT